MTEFIKEKRMEAQVRMTQGGFKEEDVNNFKNIVMLQLALENKDG